MNEFEYSTRRKSKGLGLLFVWHPFRVRKILDLVTGGIAVLNHRLKASILPGCREIKVASVKRELIPFSLLMETESKDLLPILRQAHDGGAFKFFQRFKSFFGWHGYKNPVMAFHSNNPTRAIPIQKFGKL